MRKAKTRPWTIDPGYPDDRIAYMVEDTRVELILSQKDLALALQALGQLWLTGVSVDWSGVYAQQTCDRIPLPTYPFERQRYWIAPAPSVPVESTTPEQTHYTFTDISSLFLVQARQKFQDYDFVEYRKLDIAKSPQNRGYERLGVSVNPRFICRFGGSESRCDRLGRERHQLHQNSFAEFRAVR